MRGVLIYEKQNLENSMLLKLNMNVEEGVIIHFLFCEIASFLISLLS